MTLNCFSHSTKTMQTGAGGVGRGGVASETATISNFISHIFTAMRYSGGGGGEGQKEAVPGNPNQPNKFTL